MIGTVTLGRDVGDTMQTGQQLSKPGSTRKTFLAASLAQTITGHGAEILELALSDHFAFSASSDKTIKCWNAVGDCLRTFCGHGDAVTSVCAARDGSWFISGCVDGTLCRWETASGRRVVVTPRKGAAPVTAVRLTPDQKFIVSRNLDQGYNVWCSQSGRLVRRSTDLVARFGNWLNSHENVLSQRAARAGLRCPFALSSDGGLILLGNHTGPKLQLVELASGRCVRQFAENQEVVHAVAFSPNGRLAFSAGSDRVVKIWDIDSGRCLRTLAGHLGEVSALSVSPDGECLVSGSWDGTARCWQVKTGQCRAILKGHRDWVNAVRIAADGKFVMSAGADAAVRQWMLQPKYIGATQVSLPSGTNVAKL